MHIIVLGAGAIGTFYGVRLAAEHPVTLIARPEHVDAIRRRGARISGLETTTAAVSAATHVETIPADTLILLTTKVYDNEAAIRPILPMLRSDTCILCLQNGLYSERVVRSLVGGACEVLRGIVQFGVTFMGPGEVALRADGWTSIEDGPRSRAIAELLARSGLDGRISADMRDEMWRKVIVNCVINPLTAVTGLEVGWVTDARIDPLKRLVADECRAVAQRDGVVIEDDVVAAINEVYRPSRNMSSMCQDLLKGRRTEIDYLNGAVVELGERVGIACPANAALAALVRAMEARARPTVDAAQAPRHTT
jgi:2-dehydropantoate 2-reductase